MKEHEKIRQSLTIESAKPEDAEGIYDVQRFTWQDTYVNGELGITPEAVRLRTEGENGELISKKIERWRDTIINNSRDVYVARSGDKVVGFVAPFYDEENEQYRIGALYVLPEAQGIGAGRALIQKAIEQLGPENDIYLHVASFNDNAIDFYSKSGFVKTGHNITSDPITFSGGVKLPELEMIRKSP
ncbi:MAG: GNAT family N-acetyltransferase [bacterium]|jgi:ribosomal protein S18 acetylase RimI-like enzyme